MTKSFKKAIACMLAVLMVAFSAPVSAFASQAIADYHPDLELQFGAFFDADTGDFSAEPVATPTAGNYGYSGLFAPALDATIQKDTTNGSISVSNLKLTASKLADYTDYWNEYCELEGDDAVQVPDDDIELGVGDYFWVTARLDNVDAVLSASAIVTYSNNIEPAGYFSCKPKTKVVEGWYSLSEAAAVDTKGNGTWSYGGSLPVKDFSADSIYEGLDTQEFSTAQTMTEDASKGRMYIMVQPLEGETIATPYAASPDEDFAYADPTTGALYNPSTGDYEGYTYDNSLICATWLFKIKGSGPIEFGVYNPDNSLYYDDEETIAYELGGGHEGGSYTQADVPMPSTSATYASEPTSPASEKFLIFGMNINSGEGTSGGGETHTHTMTAYAANAATCTAAGNSAYWYCSGCEKYFSDANGDTEIESGSWAIAALGHDYAAVVTAPTCTEAGYTTYTCSRCGDSYTEPGEAATGHSYGAWADYDATNHAKTCGACGDVVYEAHIAGEAVEEAGVAPTATEAGYHYEVISCTVCGRELSRTQVTDPALGENYTFDRFVIDTNAETATAVFVGDVTGTEDARPAGLDIATVDADCENDGSKTYTASYDGVTATEANGGIVVVPIDALGHDYESEVTEATCLTGGYTTYTCSRCGDNYTDDEVPALGHDMQLVTPGSPATCEDAGAEDYYECSRCDATEGGAVIPALGHNWGEWETVTDATKTKDGLKKRVCGRCGDEETEAIPSLDIIITVESAVGGSVSGSINSGETASFKFGDQYILEATANDGYEFKGWIVNGKNVGTSATYKSKAYNDLTITPLFAETVVTETYTVVFLDLYKNVVSKQTVSAPSQIEVPTDAVMARQGYTFTGWSVDPTTVTASTDIVGKYDVNDSLMCTVTTKIGNDTISTESIAYDTQVTVSNENAVGWRIGETVVALGTSYTFYVGADVTLEVVTEAVELEPSVVMLSTEPARVEGSHRFNFVATRVVPAGYKLEKAGFVYGKNLADSDLIIDKAGTKGSNADSGNVKVAYSDTTKNINEFVLQYGLTDGPTNRTGTAKAKAFIIVSKDNVKSVIYSEVATGDYSQGMPTNVGGDD